MKKIILLFIIAAAFNVHAFAQKDSTDTARDKPHMFITHHSVKINGVAINYTATVGTFILKNEKDESVAIFGFTAYTKDGEGDLSKRPVTFAYNGGPGSSSMWLHMGALGPRRVVVNDPATNSGAPYTLVDNEYSIIDVTDLVMIDPVGTGLSHPINKATNKDFWGVDQDMRSISNFIKQYVTENSRWNSPKYLLGESYGTTRSAAIVDHLQEDMGMAMNGVILVSAVLDFRTLEFLQGDDLSYVLHIPTYAAVAWYHNKLANKPANLEAFLQEVRDFSNGEYASDLMKGDALSDAEKQILLTKLSAYTGLSKDYWDKAELRVTEPQFTQELLRADHQTTGRLDARYKGYNQDLLSEFAQFDPQSSQISPPYIAGFMSYYYDELKVNKSFNYHVNAYSSDGFRWDWTHAANGGQGDPVLPNTAVDLADAMSKNPNLKVLVFNGYFDLATPFYGTEYTFDHMGLEKDIRANITMKYYAAGHMMYVNPSCLVDFKKNIAAFITGK